MTDEKRGRRIMKSLIQRSPQSVRRFVAPGTRFRPEVAGPLRRRDGRRPARPALLCECLEARTLLTGTLDDSFGGDGKVTTAFDLGGGDRDVVAAVTVDGLGRTL